jgi:MFS family permease
MPTAEGAHGPGALVREALGTPPLRRLQLSWALCTTGDWAFTIVLGIYAYGEGGAGAVGLAALVRSLPAALAAPVTGLLADRHSRRDLLLILVWGRALAAGAIAASIAAALPFAVVLALAAVFTILWTGHKPAQAGLLTELARTPSQLGAANALWGAIDYAGFLAGSVLSGVLVVVASLEAAFVVMAILFVLAALALWAIARDPVPEHREVPTGASAWHEAVLGLRAIARDRGLRTVLGLSAALFAVHGALEVLTVVLALDLLGIGQGGVGWLNAAWGVGGLLGGAVVLVLLGRGRLARGLVAGAVLTGLPLCLLAAEPTTTAALAALLVLGVGSAIIETGTVTFTQRLTSDEVLARVFGVQELSLQVTTAIGAITAPLLIHLLGTRGALVAVGAVLPALALLWWRSLVRLEAEAGHVPLDRLALVRALPMFAALPPATKETLARRMASAEVMAGETVIREGEHGERFYVIASGEVQVSQNGRVLRREGRGEAFGEIALLRHVQRTATVIAVTDLELLWLDRETFVSAISGQRRCAWAADRLIEERQPELAR